MSVEHTQEFPSLIPWISQAIGFLLTAAFGLWAWVVKKFGEQHIESVRELANELREIRKEVNSITARVQTIEYIQRFHHEDVEAK